MLKGQKYHLNLPALLHCHVGVLYSTKGDILNQAGKMWLFHYHAEGHMQLHV